MGNSSVTPDHAPPAYSATDEKPTPRQLPVAIRVAGFKSGARSLNGVYFHDGALKYTKNGCDCFFCCCGLLTRSADVGWDGHEWALRSSHSSAVYARRMDVTPVGAWTGSITVTEEVAVPDGCQWY